ncbi:MAG TPA: Trm112 family protein [Thermoplasmatales archaeon]|nr:Trm112 family protein [Thermoplasmatales archaeon]
MKKKFAGIFLCPSCHGELELHVSKEKNDEILEGFFICNKCSKKYGIKDGTPTFI